MADEKNIADFISITNSNRATAIRCLSKANGDIESAISEFYNTEGAGTSGGAAGAPGGSRGVGNRQRSGGIASLNDLRDGGDDRNKEGNDYYVGGEKSGQIVQGGPPGEGGDLEALFQKAREAGAELGRESDLMSSSAQRGFQSFTGRGQTLSGIPVGAPASEQAEGPGEVTATVTFYANGVFTVNDGEPRQIQDPANAMFMKSIMEGQCPPELIPEDPRTAININLVRKQEDYEPPAEPKYRAFAGTGHTLAASNQEEEKAPAVDVPQGMWKGPDESKPTTSVQIRLADGSRLVAKFNLTQTVGNIRQFLMSTRPELGNAFRLTTSFPTKDLVDVDETIEHAGLAGAVVFQK
jgi:UBX domain-containing protein 1